jgi:hypothetical protein
VNTLAFHTHPTSARRRMRLVWWVLGIVAVWLLIGALVAVWIGRGIRRADVEESATESPSRSTQEPPPEKDAA